MDISNQDRHITTGSQELCDFDGGH
jgi:hypothetical protein